jgi:hypothetical protein
MKNFFQVTMFMGCMAALIIAGCKKHETTQVDNETQSSVDNAIADQEYSAVVPTVNNHAIYTKGAGTNGRLMASPCTDSLKFVSGDTSDFIPNVIYTLNITSGTTVCTPMPDGLTRTGTLSIRLTGKIKQAGSQMIIKMLGYKKETIGYSCDSMVVTTIASTTLSTTFNVKLINGICQSPNWVIKYSSDRTVTHYPHGNPYGTDPVTEVYGTASGTNRQNLAFSVNIPSSTPLIKHKSCAFIDKGIMQLTPAGYNTRTIDYGDGTCNDDATFSVNGNTIAFKLK